ncbi:MAG: M56 family metallopeptidase, partial [bacterium]|nr:M56 family metallopeptidase [bacterium]
PVATGWTMPWLELGVTIWLVGLVAFLLVQAVGYARFRRHMLADATPLGQEGRISIITSPHASGPLAFGVWRPYIVLPADFALRYDAQEQAMAIAHERAHHQHGDLAANMVALVLLAIHWCNPIAWIAYRAYRADQETACDARVLALYGQDQAHAYGRAILKAAGGRQFAAACHLTRITTLKGRLKMLSNHETSLNRISWGMAAIAIVTAAGLALTASGSRAAQEMAAITDKMDGVNFARLTDMVSQPAAASEAVQAEAWMSSPAPAQPAAVAAAKTDWPAVPPAPVVPAADMIAPIPPVPPVPPVTVRSQANAVVVTHANGRVETHRIPTEAEIARMIPVVDVTDGCDGSGKASRRESVGADGRRVIRVRICQAGIERAVRAADRSAAQADRMAVQADRESARAERAARAADVAALSHLRTARINIARNLTMPEADRVEALREIDRDIADMRAGQD